MDYLQKWWEEKYPNAGVKEVKNVSEGVLDLEHLIDFEQWLVKNFDLYRVSGSCPIEAIMHYDKLIKTKLERTFEPLRDHGIHAEFCDKINDLREEAKSNYR
jgi:hypothetical protein